MQDGVLFRYLFDDDRRYYCEMSSKFACPLCPMRCINLWVRCPLLLPMLHLLACQEC